MAPYLLFGFACAGLLHSLLPEEKILRHLTGRKMGAFIKATLLGIPLPLCSCGVIPVAAHLRKMGASKGPVLAFIAATPTTGVDSIAATYSLMGGAFTLIRTAADMTAGLLAGFLVNIIDPDPDPEVVPSPSETLPRVPGKLSVVARALEYGFVELVSFTAKWLVIGIVLGGVITTAVPTGWIEAHLSNPILAYLAVVAVAVPMYVCATGSIPIATALVMKGLSPGAGLVFLVAGPATNTATIAFVGGRLGRRSLFIYLGSIVATAVLFGAGLDWFLAISGHHLIFRSDGMSMLPTWLHTSAALVLLLLLLRAALPSHAPQPDGTPFRVGGMTCGKCEKRVRDAVGLIQGVDAVNVNRARSRVVVSGTADKSLIRKTIEDLGYTVED